MAAKNQPQLLDPDSAYAVVQERVYAPVFFTKLANDYGVQPANSNEAAQMLQMAEQLRNAHEQNEKAAASRGNPLLNAAQQHLGQALGHVGYDMSAQQGKLIEKAASEVAYDPDVAYAVLSLQAGAAMAQSQQ